MIVIFEKTYLRELFETGRTSEKNIAFSRIS